jgi:hypothetical protein
MDAIFSGLTKEENHKLLDAIPLITLLIGTADGDIDEKEISWAQRVTKFRSYTYDKDLQHYYQELNEIFEDRLAALFKTLPKGNEARQEYLKLELAKMDPLLQKIEGDDSYALYHDFLSFAKHVAKSSGGVLYMANVSPAEKALLGLDMLTPIENHPGI